MRPTHRDGHTTEKHWARHLMTAAAVSTVSLGFLVEPIATVAQTGPVRFGRKPQPAVPSSSGFAQTVKQLMEQARREAAAGNVDEAIKTSQRASKIAEAAASMLGASPDCSPAAAEQLHRELLALRPSTSPAPASQAVAQPSATVRETPPNMEQWQPQVSSNDTVPPPVVAKIIAAPRSQPVPEEVYFPVEAAESIEIESPVTTSRPAVVLKRTYVASAPLATELGLESTLSIIGGTRPVSPSVEPRRTLPLGDAVVANGGDAEPDWMRSEAPVDAAIDPTAPLLGIVPSESARPDAAAFVEMTVVPAKPEWETPHVTAQEAPPAESVPGRLRLVSDWNSSGAVVRKQRIARSESLRTDGWESLTSSSNTVTRAGGSVSDETENPAKEAVAPTAYRASTANGLFENLPVGDQEQLRIAPPPPEDFDEDDVVLQSPSVWKREGVATLPATEASKPSELSPVWQRFTAWAQRRGWTATAALMGIAAAVMAVAAFILALIPRERIARK